MTYGRTGPIVPHFKFLVLRVKLNLPGDHHDSMQQTSIPAVQASAEADLVKLPGSISYACLCTIDTRY